MRTVILEENEKVVSFKSIDHRESDTFIGVESNPGGKRGFVTRTGYDTGHFTVFCPTYLTNGNGWDVAEQTTDFHNFIQGLLVNGWIVVEFKSFIELMTWVSEGKNA